MIGARAVSWTKRACAWAAQDDVPGPAPERVQVSGLETDQGSLVATGSGDPGPSYRLRFGTGPSRMLSLFMGCALHVASCRLSGSP